MKSTSAAMDTHLAGECTSLATCWRMTRTDGVQFHFTDHDQEVPFDLDGSGVAIYDPSASFNRTAIQTSTGLSVDNLDLVGIFDDDAIKEDELRLGLFDKATIEIFSVNWLSLDDGSIKLRKGTLGEVIVSEGGTYQVELRGLAQEASQTIGKNYTVDCTADLGDSECKIPIFPDVVQRSTAYVLDDFVRASNSIFTLLSLTNPDAETGDTSGWTSDTGALAVRGVSPAPSQGSLYFTGGTSVETIARQDISVSVPFETKIDAGEIGVNLIWLQNSLSGEATLDQAEMQLQFLDNAAQQIGATSASGLQSPASWTTRIFDSPVPAGTRTIRIRQRMVRNTSPNNDGLIDDIRLSLVDLAPLCEDFDDRIYVVTVAGTTGLVQPSYDDIVGNITVDGTVTFTAEEAWSRCAEVVAVDVTETRKRFLVGELTPNTGGPRGGFPDDWFNGGVATFETGLNAGKSMEVRTFLADDGITIEQEIILFLDLPFEITVGDKLRIYPGCDKRKTTCITKFDNLLNFRGFSFIPGPDRITQFPDAKT